MRVGCELSHGGDPPGDSCSTPDSGYSSPNSGCTALDNGCFSLKSGCSPLAGGWATPISGWSSPGEGPKGSSGLAEGAAPDRCTSCRSTSWESGSRGGAGAKWWGRGSVILRAAWKGAEDALPL